MADKDDRRTLIGGSDAGAALGLSPWKTARELWYEKRGELPRKELDAERVRFGILLEDTIAGEFAQRNGYRLRRQRALVRHPRYPFIGAHIDRRIEGERVGVECKCVDAFAFRSDEWGHDFTDCVPMHYLVQCVVYMAVLDFERWYLAALVGGNTLRTYLIERDTEFEALVLDGLREFWQRVESGEPPPFDYDHPTTPALMRRLYPGTDGGVVALDDAVQSWHEVRIEADAMAKRYTAVEKTARLHILECMGDAGIGQLPGGGEYRRTMVERSAYDVDETEYVQLRYFKPRTRKEPA